MKNLSCLSGDLTLCHRQFIVTQKHFNPVAQRKGLLMKITVIGTDYLGLVIGAYCAEAGGNVVCYDSDTDNIQSLQRCRIPVMDPELQSMMARNKGAGRLRFTHDVVNSIAHAELIFITSSGCSIPSVACRGCCLSRTLKNVLRWGNRCAVVLVISTTGKATSLDWQTKQACHLCTPSNAALHRD